MLTDQEKQTELRSLEEQQAVMQSTLMSLDRDIKVLEASRTRWQGYLKETQAKLARLKQ